MADPSAIDREKAKALGFSDEEIALIIEKREEQAFESAKARLENSKELKALKAKVKSFGYPVRIVVERIAKNADGNLATDPTLRVTYPAKSSGNSNSAGRAKTCRVDGKEYESFAAACKAHNLPCEKISGKIVLERALRAGTIKSFEVLA